MSTRTIPADMTLVVESPCGRASMYTSNDDLQYLHLSGNQDSRFVRIINMAQARSIISAMSGYQDTLDKIRNGETLFDSPTHSTSVVLRRNNKSMGALIMSVPYTGLRHADRSIVIYNDQEAMAIISVVAYSLCAGVLPSVPKHDVDVSAEIAMAFHNQPAATAKEIKSAIDPDLAAAVDFISTKSIIR